MWKAWILSVIAAGITSLVAPNDATAADGGVSPPSTVTSPQDGKVISLLGFDICFGDGSTSCDVRLPALPQSNPPAKRITLLGKTLCVGASPQTPGCDVRLPPMDKHG
jgi:hypothetical protein